nr:rabenosyn-5-like [Onthophagus taurus]
MAESNGDHKIKEGFICPTCHKTCQSANHLLGHFQEKHSEEQDLLKSLKDLVSKAKKKILSFDEQDIEKPQQERYYLEESKPQEVSTITDHTDFFKAVRRERLDHRTTETNRLILRLDKLLKVQGSDRKQQEQRLVAWLDGTTVSRCPSCAANFNLAKRQHHCRLCGSIMCNNCSEFLAYDIARTIVTPKYTEETNISLKSSKNESDSLRICGHCMNMLECRRYIQMHQMVQPRICLLYEQLRKVKAELLTSVDLYEKMHLSLSSGDTTYHLQDVQALKGSIAKEIESLDAISQAIATLPVDDSSKLQMLQYSIRRSITHYVKDFVLTLPAVPTLEELEKAKQNRYTLLEDAERHSTVNIRKVTVTTGWSPSNVNETIPDEEEDPLLQQMNIVRSYIDQARKANRFEEVASLEENLKLLKESYRKQERQD